MPLASAIAHLFLNASRIDVTGGRPRWQLGLRTPLMLVSRRCVCVVLRLGHKLDSLVRTMSVCNSPPLRGELEQRNINSDVVPELQQC